MQAVSVSDASQVAEARRAATALAHAHGFGEEDAGRVALVATELATNLLKHGGGGELLLGDFDDATGSGVECLALDRGSGMEDVELSMRDGHSTAGSPGTGLGAVLRGSHATDIYSMRNGGTAVLARCQAGKPDSRRAADHPRYGAVAIAMPGEEVCGDAWGRRTTATGCAYMVADGLGHGPSAATASQAAAKAFRDSSGEDASPAEMLARMHAALVSTRGAAIAVADWNRDGDRLAFAGVGNVAGTIVGPDGSTQRMVSMNGIVGHNAKSIREFSYPLGTEPLLVLASDGLATSWKLDSYPGLAAHHPTLIAGILYRDFSRRRDDVTVLVARGCPA